MPTAKHTRNGARAYNEAEKKDTELQPITSWKELEWVCLSQRAVLETTRGARDGRGDELLTTVFTQKFT